jgi:molecular chaperone DnaK (HSP70)
VSVYEGERATTDGNEMLGEFTIRGIEHAKRGVPQVDVTFELDANGILNVTAVDSKTKARAHISISNNRGRRSADEIDRMVAEAERLAKDDAKRLELIEARNELESLMYTAKDVARAHEDHKLMGMLAELQRWLDDSVTPSTPVREVRDKTELLHVVLGSAGAKR